jgi:hypothetical protein
MSFSEDNEFRTAYKYWTEQMDYYQYQIFSETVKIVDLLKHKTVSAKTKNEIIIVIKGLQATTKSISKVLSKYVK